MLYLILYKLILDFYYVMIMGAIIAMLSKLTGDEVKYEVGLRYMLIYVIIYELFYWPMLTTNIKVIYTKWIVYSIAILFMFIHSLKRGERDIGIIAILLSLTAKLIYEFL